MAYKATREIDHIFTMAGIKHKVLDHGTASVVAAGYDGDNAHELVFQFISHDDDADVSVRCFGIFRNVHGNLPMVLMTLNALNCKFRYMKFVLDQDGDINAEYDFPMAAERVGLAAAELCQRMIQIIDEAYPILDAVIL